MPTRRQRSQEVNDCGGRVRPSVFIRDESGLNLGFPFARLSVIHDVMTANATSTRDGSTAPRWKWITLAVAVLGSLLAVRYLPVQDSLRHMLDTLAGWGPWGVVMFILLYIVATVLLVPGTVLTLGAGAVFGVGWGSLYVSIASTLGATAAFLVGRYLAREAIGRRIDQNPRFASIDRAVAKEGWKIVGLTRLSPVFPFTLLNYAFGLTQVKLGHYIIASWIGMMPGTLLYVYLGSLARIASGDRPRSAGEWTLYGIGLLATLLVAILATRIAKKTLDKKAAA
jgi:uncharacterized membrane protein YdjX (TVP38/TMEM64 family)